MSSLAITPTPLASLSRRSIREVIASNQIEPIDATMNHTDNGFSLGELNQLGVIQHAARRETDDNELARGSRRSNEKLPGMRHYFAAVSPLGSVVHVGLWDSDEQANQMSQLNEMIVTARSHAEAVGFGLP
jgi:hypothetical protein